MAFRLFDRVAETSTTTGTGTLTLAGAKTGYRAFSAVFSNNDTTFYTIAHQSADEWEVGVGTWQTGGSLVRSAVLASSNSGSAVSFSSGTKDVFVTGPAKSITPRRQRFCGRLTTESGVAVSTSDRTSQGTLYYTPTRSGDCPGNEVSIYNTTMGEWETITFSETSLAVSISSGQLKDVFAYNNSGTLALEFSSAWASDTSRTDALTTQDGIRVKSSDKSRLWVGTVCGTGTNVVEDSLTSRYVVNAHNRMPRGLYKADSTSFWSSTGSAYQLWNPAAPVTLFKAIVLPDYPLELQAEISCSTLVTGTLPCAGISQDYTSGTPTTIADTFNFLWSNNANVGCLLRATYSGFPAEGRHTYHALQNPAGSTAYFYGSYLGTANKSSLKGTIWS